MGAVNARADCALPRQRQASEMAEPEPPLATTGLDLNVAARSSLEWQLLAVGAELVLVEELRSLQQLADGAAPDVGVALGMLGRRGDEAQLWLLRGSGATRGGSNAAFLVLLGNG